MCGSSPDTETVSNGVGFLQEELNGVHEASERSQTTEQEVRTQFREDSDAGSPEHLLCAPPARGGFSSASVPSGCFAVGSPWSL